MNDLTRAALDAIFEVEGRSTDIAVPAPVKVADEVLPASPQTSALPTLSASQAIDAVQQPPAEPTQDEKDLDEDFQYSRGALKALAEDGQTTFARAADVAQQTDHPRGFEAAAAILKATLEVHREIAALHKNRAEVKQAKAAKDSGGGNVNIKQGIVFQGNPTDILKQLKPERS